MIIEKNLSKALKKAIQQFDQVIQKNASAAEQVSVASEELISQSAQIPLRLSVSSRLSTIRRTQPYPHQAAHRITDINGVGSIKIGSGQDLLLHLIGKALKEISAENPGQQTAIYRRGIQHIAVLDEDGSDAALGNLAMFIGKNDFKIPFGQSPLSLQAVEGPLGCFMVEENRGGVSRLFCNDG